LLKFSTYEFRKFYHIKVYQIQDDYLYHIEGPEANVDMWDDDQWYHMSRTVAYNKDIGCIKGNKSIY
jgi:hypothetical protein